MRASDYAGLWAFAADLPGSWTEQYSKAMHGVQNFSALMGLQENSDCIQFDHPHLMNTVKTFE